MCIENKLIWGLGTLNHKMPLWPSNLSNKLPKIIGWTLKFPRHNNQLGLGRLYCGMVLWALEFKNTKDRFWIFFILSRHFGVHYEPYNMSIIADLLEPRWQCYGSLVISAIAWFIIEYIINILVYRCLCSCMLKFIFLDCLLFLSSSNLLCMWLVRSNNFMIFCDL